jgi:hypothetical protein
LRAVDTDQPHLGFAETIAAQDDAIFRYARRLPGPVLHRLLGLPP